MADTPGLWHLIAIDGVDLSVNPESINAVPALQETNVDTIGDSVLFSDWVLAGLPDKEGRLRISLSPMSGYDGEEADDELRLIRRIKAKSGHRTLSLWKPDNAFYTATAGQVRFLFPRRRRHAPESLGRDGATKTACPFRCWITPLGGSATEQTAVFAAGPAVATPADGTVNVARTPHTSGDEIDYTEFRVRECTAGEIIEIEYYPLLIVAVVDPAQAFPNETREEHSLAFMER